VKLALVLLAALGCQRDSTSSPGTTAEPIAQKFVDELVPADRGRELRVVGTVEGPVRVSEHDGERVVRFVLSRGDRHLPVLATGVLPDRFREHVTAIAEGRWLDDRASATALSAHGLVADGEIFDATAVIVPAPELPR
jgi:cytochrome c-type biogenesis protein CcmE